MDIFYFDINLKPIKILDTLSVSNYQETAQLNGQITSTLTSTYYPEIRNAEYFGSRDVDNPNDFRIYRIINQSASNHQMTSHGIHKLFDDLKSGVVRDIRPQNVSASEALSRILSNANSDWELGLNYTSNAYASSSYYRQSLLSAFWDLVETWNIEFKPRITFSNGEITGQYIDIYDRVSDDYGKMYDTKDKLISVVEDSDRSELYTALIGYGKGEQVGDGFGRGIDFEDVEWSVANGDPIDKPLGQDYIELPSATAVYGFRLGIVEFSDEELPSRLLDRTWNQLQITSRPKREFSTHVSETEHVELGEIVGIIDSAIDIKYKTRIYELTRDFLVRGIKQIKFGDKVVVSSAERIKQQEKENIELVEQATQSMYDQIMDSIIIDFNNEDAYMYNLEIGNPYGLPAGEYSFDRPIDQNPTKVVYQGAGQILIANSKLPNGEWDFTTALNADGLGAEIIGALQIHASQIISGNLTLTDNLKIVDQYGNDVLYIDSSGRVRLDASNMLNQSDLDDYATNEQVWNAIRTIELTPGEDGKDAVQWTIGEDGYWYADGVKTDKKAVPEDGSDADIWTIGANGNWFKNGVDTGLPSKGSDGYTPIKGVDYFDGVDGQDGKGITSAEVTYQNHTNGTTAPTGTWTENPSPIKGQYLWTRTVTTYTEGSPVNTYSVAYQAIDGTSGTDGTDGRGIVSTVVDYVKSTTATMPSSGWSTTRPTVNKGEYLWTRTTINYTSGSPSVAISNSYVPTDGQNGSSAYLWVRYSQNANGDPMTTSPTNAKYIGVATTSTSTAPDGYELYSWSLIKGQDGVKGEAGQDGQTSYLHIKYSNDGGLTFTGNGGEDVGEWIGTYVDFTKADSNDVDDYTWNRVKGDKGDDGVSQYVHIRYSANSNGNPMTPSPQATTKYIGLAINNSSTAPTGYASYSWALFKGQDGTDGVDGIDGDDGNPNYTWVKYADDELGENMSDYPAGKMYIGLAFNKTTPTESSDPLDYQWSAMYDLEALSEVRESITTVNSETANRISELQREWESELEYIDGNLQTSISDIQAQYLADLDSWSDKINENELSLNTLGSRVVAVETDLGENSVRWNAIDNSMIFAEEGLFVGNVDTNTGSWIRSSGSFDITLDGNTVGSFSNDGLTTEAIVTGTMQIGSYIHQSLSDGSMVIQWVS